MNKKFQKIGKGALIAGLGAVLAYLTAIDWESNAGPMWGAVFAVLLNGAYQAIRKENSKDV